MPQSAEKSLYQIYTEMRRVAGLPSIAGASAPPSAEWSLQNIYEVVANWSPGGSGGGAPSGAAGGSLGGTYPNPTVPALAAKYLVMASSALLANEESVGALTATSPLSDDVQFNVPEVFRVASNGGNSAFKLEDDVAANLFSVTLNNATSAINLEDDATRTLLSIFVGPTSVLNLQDDAANTLFSVFVNGSSMQLEDDVAATKFEVDLVSGDLVLVLQGSSGSKLFEVDLNGLASSIAFEDDATATLFSVSLASNDSIFVISDFAGDLTNGTYFQISLNSFEDQIAIFVNNNSEESSFSMTLGSFELIQAENSKDLSNTLVQLNARNNTYLRLQSDSSFADLEVEVSDGSNISAFRVNADVSGNWIDGSINNGVSSFRFVDDLAGDVIGTFFSISLASETSKFMFEDDDNTTLFSVSLASGNSRLILDDALGFELDIGSGNYLKLDNLPTADPDVSDHVWAFQSSSGVGATVLADLAAAMAGGAQILMKDAA